MSIPQLILKQNKFGTFAGRHPWVMAKSVVKPQVEIADGDVVDLVTLEGRWVGRGIYNQRSHLCVRLYSWTRGEELNDDFWRGRLAAAVQLRRMIGYDDPAGATRLVFSEADGLSGLIVDRYGRYLVVQVAALAMQKRLELIVPLLAELAQPAGILVRTDEKIAAQEGMERRDGVAWGEAPPTSLDVYENGLLFRVDLASGQKTGYYLDQRENHRVAAMYMKDRRVLDVCCYVGGFALAAAKIGGAREVLGIDSSEKAVLQARDHAAANQLPNVTFEVGECFRTLEQKVAAGEKFGGVILDPPRFAASRDTVDQALRAYHRLNRLAVQLLEPGGILVTCSCSGRVSREQFLKMLSGVSQKTGRDLQILEQRGPAPDHPVRISCPETDYLKCFVCRAM